MKIVIAYSGGLDTSVILQWLKDTYKADIITFTADLGQDEDLDGLPEKARSTGAAAHHTVDLVDEFARDFIYPMVRANAIYEGQYYLGTAIARPLIAKAMIDVARREKADALAHGATGKGNDQCRFEFTFAALAPDLKVIAPWRIEEFRKTFPGRSEMIKFCKHNGIDVGVTAAKPYSIDRNLFHVSYEAGALEDLWFDPTLPENKDMFELTTAPEDAPDSPEYVELDFERGDCTAVNGEALIPAEVLRALNKLGGKHGIGRADVVENRLAGMKNRGVYETPGGAILMHAHRQVESLTLDRDLMHLRDGLIPKYAEIIYYGFWFAPERVALQALIVNIQIMVTGTVRLILYKGNIISCGRKSTVSLYDPKIASMEATDSDYDHSDATGFIRLQSLRLRARHAIQDATDTPTDKP